MPALTWRNAVTLNRSLCYGALCSVLFLVLTSFIFCCSQNNVVRICIMAELTGPGADIGTSCRDGAILAVEEANEHGGLRGRGIELLVRNIPRDEAGIRQTVAEIDAAEVSAIIGPATSASALVIVPEINRLQIPTISPTVATELLEGLDDFFFRIFPVSTGSAVKTANYAYHWEGLRNLVVVYDRGNKGYTEPFYTTIKNNFEKFGDSQVAAVGYLSASGFDFLALARSLKDREMDGLVILASGIDTALICQQLEKLKVEVPIFASDWAFTEELIEFGGKTVEGVKVFRSFQLNSTVDSYRDFSLVFQKRFGYSPDFASTHGYNAVKILLQALTKTTSPSPQQLKETILGGSPYIGIQNEIRLDEYGDAERQYSLQTIKNGKIVTI